MLNEFILMLFIFVIYYLETIKKAHKAPNIQQNNKVKLVAKRSPGERYKTDLEMRIERKKFGDLTLTSNFWKIRRKNRISLTFIMSVR